MEELWFVFRNGRLFFSDNTFHPVVAWGYAQKQNALDAIKGIRRKKNETWEIRRCLVTDLSQTAVKSLEAADDEDRRKSQQAPWSVRTENCLANAKVETLTELSRWTAARLLRLSNFGPKSLAEVRKILALHGMKLQGD